MSDRMMTVDEAREWVAQDKSSRNTVSAARTIIAQAEQIERLQAALREADRNWWDALNSEYDYTCSPEGFVSTYEGLAPGDMEPPEGLTRKGM